MRLLLIRRASESAQTNAVMVVIKIAVLIMFIVIGVQGWNSDNLSPFAPFGFAASRPRRASSSSPTSGSTAVSTAGEEVKNPRRTSRSRS